MTVYVDRRIVVLLGAGAVLAACTAQPRPTRPAASTPAGTPTGTPPTSPVPSATPSATQSSPMLPAVIPWRPGPGELDPGAKRAAVREVERLGNRHGAALQVLDAQYGGLLTGSASVLVVTRAWHLQTGRLHADGSTFDVRVERSGQRWRVTDVRPSRPGPPRRPLTARERAVLGSHRIGLPPAGRSDVLSGQVHPSVLSAMLDLSRRYRLDVSVVRSGHPLYVFGTGRLSDHPQGRAFDTWRIDGHPVVDPGTPRALVTGYMRAAAATGAYNVGGPYLLGSAPQYFSDRTHHDHVHAGFLA
jgi:hypothetical protein